MKLAFTISAYRLCDFVHLGLKQLRRLSPESEILVSDDISPESPGIAALASQNGAAYICSKKRRGHFSGDIQSLVYALGFARDRECDVAVKVSQRFIFRKVEAIEAIKRAFENPNICAATPGQPRVNGHAPAAAKGFGQFTTLSDVVSIRTNALSPEELLHMYRKKITTDRAPWASFIEICVDLLHSEKFPGRTLKLEELTNPTSDPIFLRRYQASDVQYRQLAGEHGFGGAFCCDEWARIDGRRYLCRPRVV